MTSIESKRKPRKLLKILGIILAWLSLPFIGFGLLFVTSIASTFQSSMLAMAESNDVTLATLNGLLGIIILLILILMTSKLRSKSFFFHLRIGLFIGIGLYLIILITGIVSNVNSNISRSEPGTCTTAKQQYLNSSSAIVPIATNLGTGSGFAVNNTSTIVTAYHVIEGAESVVANYSSGEVKLEVIDTAPQYDLALLRIEKPTDSYFKLSEIYSETDDVLVYGYPGNSLSAGPPSISGGIISRVIDIASLRMTSQDLLMALR